MTPKEIIDFLRAMSKARTAYATAASMGDASAKRNGRDRWNLDDYRVAVEAFDAMCPATTPDDLMARAKHDHDATVQMGGTT